MEGVERNVEVVIQGSGNSVEAGKVKIQEWSQRQRTVRALKMGGMCWGFAVIALFIPLLHFLLVPAFLLAGPVLAFFVYRQEATILGGEGICPDCKASFKVARASAQFPLSDVCENCKDEVRIKVKGENA